LSEGFRVALIGGMSNVGKSTTGAALAARLGWDYRSTDKLARHPGRPWLFAPAPVPDHVAEHYTTLTPDQLIASVLAHYRNMRPMLRELIVARAGDAAEAPLVLEGSALWPEFVAELDIPGVRAVWLTADHALIEARIRRDSAIETLAPRERTMTENFIARTRLYDDAMMAAVRRLGLPFVEVADGTGVEAIVDACLAVFSGGGAAAGGFLAPSERRL
jgi:2-phosphoglycerate kinase